ncbi:MAG: UTP--glucose-1-phosphate uridylyltransferase [Syntrophobacterales bacterium]|jgi:UDP-N-acetylglucosamine/UDP-N-acetylgalactosamine diphosphorylase|nr:UTP--glucose-1-phosphate uridylyltransferase [Syntrophobacterales bacterium]
MTEEGLIQILTKHSQFHILNHYRSLPSEKKRIFLGETKELDFDLVFALYNEFKDQKGASSIGAIGSAPIVAVPKTVEQEAQRREAHRLGEAMLKEDKVAALIVAGGQGSRLGFEGPKGAFPISPVRNKSPFHLFAEALKAMSIRYGATIPLLIMTSRENHRETQRYFESFRHFDLDPHNVHFFQQGMLPTMTPSGQLILKDETHLFANPDGHGGSLKAIHDSGLLDLLLSTGYTDLFYCQVDNPLVKMADPVFLGYHRMADAEMSTKVVRRTNIEEKVGVYVTLDGKERILEYSDLGGTHMSLLDANGEVLYWGGNTAIHAFNLSFIKHLNHHGFHLPCHRASKVVDSLGNDGKTTKIDGWKFETFVFDAIPMAQKTCCMEVIREEEFSPVKNREGVDSPLTARSAMSNLFRKWLEETGAKIAPEVLVEISPLFAVDSETLAEKLSGRTISIIRDTYFGD